MPGTSWETLVETTAPLRPIRAKERIEALDAVRGFALLGIFLVNIHLFAAPIGEMFSPAPPEGSSTLDSIAHYAVKALATGKFYPLFSMMFGMGMAIQLMRARQAGRTSGMHFAAFYWRRLVVLGAIGLAHALLLWYGDILFVYAIAGTIMMLLIGLKPKTLTTIGVILVLISALMMGGMTALGGMMDPNQETPAPMQGDAEPTNGPAPADEEQDTEADEVSSTSTDQTVVETESRPVQALLDGFAAGKVTGGAADPLWMEAERSAHAEGPLTDLLIMRAMNWVSMIIFWQLLMGGFLHVLAMFCFGAALMKAEFFHASRRTLQWKLMIAGFAVGLPLAIVATFWPIADERIIPAKLGASLAMVIGGPLMSMGYLAAITLLVESRPGALVARALANLGRLALTNYLMQTILATSIFYYWGFALFDQVSVAEAVGIALAIYAFQIAFSAIWLRLFRIGPAEWLWRTLTYLRPQPLFKERTTSTETAPSG